MLTLFFAACVSAAVPPSPGPGALIFSDDFERTDIGERWKVSVQAFRIVDGALRAQQMRPEHGAVGAIEAPMRDGVVEFKFRFEGATRVNAVWDHKGFTGSHAGHLCRVAITPRQIRLGDDREGAMRPKLGDELRVSLDGVAVGSLKSPGIAHPTKTHFHFTVSGKDARFDDVRVWRTDAPTK